MSVKLEKDTSGEILSSKKIAHRFLLDSKEQWAVMVEKFIPLNEAFMLNPTLWP